MKLNRICMTALLMGAAAIATPAFAAEDQAAAGAQNNVAVEKQANADASAKTDNSAAASASTNAQAADASAGTQAVAQADTQAAAPSPSTDVGARSAANANVDAVGDTSKKYRRANRGADFAKEQEITKQLNSQAASAAAPSTANRL